MIGSESVFQRAIVGVDGRQGGRDAVRLASMLVGAGGQITLVHVRGRIYDEHDVSASERTLAREAAASGLELDTVSIADPFVGRALNRAVEKRGADVLVLGSCGRGPIGRVLIGDDSRRVLSDARCAVALAPHGYAPAHHEIATIGVGYVQTCSGEAALKLARVMATERAAKIRALTATNFRGRSEPDLVRERRQRAQERLNALGGVEGEAVPGSVEEQLVRFSEVVDLLVIGSTARSFSREVVDGASASRLARRSRCPLLIAPPVAEQRREQSADMAGAYALA